MGKKRDPIDLLEDGSKAANILHEERVRRSRRRSRPRSRKRSTFAEAGHGSRSRISPAKDMLTGRAQASERNVGAR